MARSSRPPTRRARSAARRLQCESLEPRWLLAAETIGLGHGLAGNYFSDAAMTNLAGSRIDAAVNFNWGSTAPLTALPAADYSVRWNGKIQAPTTGTYTFYATTGADDGLRFTIYTADLAAIGGRKANTVIDTWHTHTAAEQSGSLALVAGETYEVRVDYQHHSGAALVGLSWSGPTLAKTVLSGSQLYPTQPQAVSSIGQNWLDSDIGTPVLAGGFSTQGVEHRVTGSGAGIGGTGDAFHFAYKVLQGEGVAVAKLDHLTGLNLDPNAQVGLMVRQNTSAGALFAGIFVAPSGSVSFLSRDSVGGAATSTVTTAGSPAWLKLIRRGPTINGYVSTTGADDAWTFVGRVDIKGLDDAVLLGLAASAYSTSGSITGHFTNVTVSSDIPLAGGLGHLATYYPNLPFIDLVKAGTGLPMRLDAGGNISTTAATVDSDGWPTENFGYRGPYAQRPDAFTGKDFLLTFNGIATVSVVAPGVGTATPANAATGDADYVAGYNAATNQSKWYLRTTDSSGGNSTAITPRFQNTQRTAASPVGSGITNIQILQPGYTSYDNQHVFTNEWLDLIRTVNEIRVKDWAFVDGNTTANWSDRIVPATPGQMGAGGFQNGIPGIAWEYLVQVANLTHKDIWVSLPAHASNDYLTKLAQLFRYGSDGVNPYTSFQANPVFRGLDPDLNVYLEYSNEVWNYVFESNSYVQSQAWAAYTGHTTYGPNHVTLDYDGRTWTSGNNLDLMYRWVAAHLKQDIVDTWASVFGTNAINTRIRPVLSGWMIYPDRTNEEGLKFLTAAGWQPKDSLYALSVAGYYGYNDLAAAQVTANTARDAATKEETLAFFEAAATAARGNLVWPMSSVLASAYGLKLVAYEAGPSLGATYAQASAQMDPRFEAIQTSIVNSWFASGAEQYNYSFLFFLNSYGNSQGDFMLSDNPWDRNQPRERSFFDLAAATSTPPVIDGFTALPVGELEARNYVNNGTPDLMYLVAPNTWETSRSYRYMVRSLEDQSVDFRLSAAATAAGQRIQVSVNAAQVATYDFATAASLDPAGRYRYSDTTAVTIHLNPGINMIDLVLTNPGSPQGAKAQINSLKFSRVGETLANSLPWIYGLTSNPQSTTAQSIPENATSNFSVSVQDLETPAVAGAASPFVVTAVSDNTALLPGDSSHIGVTYTASAARYTLALTPVRNMTGRVNLTVTVSDAGGAARSWIIPFSVVPAPPTNVVATASADGSVTVSWSNNSQVAPTYRIERNLVFGGNSWVQVGLTAAGATSWTDRPPGGASYYYRITAIDAGGLTGNSVAANSSAAVAVPVTTALGSGLNATNLFTGKTYFATSTDTTPNGGGQAVLSAFDGTNQYFAFNATSGNALAITKLDGTTSIDVLKFYFPSGAGGPRMPAVSIYYSANDYSSAGAGTALNVANYTLWGSASRTLYQAGVTPVATQPDAVQVTTLSGLALPASARSILLRFDTSTVAPYLSEIQAFAALGTTAPAGVNASSSWIQFDTKSFANYVGATVTLTWTNPNSASVPSSFVVQRDTTTAFNSAGLRTWSTPLNATSFYNDRDYQERSLNPYAPTWDTNNRNTPLAASTTYYYRVGTRQADGSIVYTAPVMVVTAAVTFPTTAPTAVTATAVSAARIDVAWNSVAGATGYKLEKSTRSNFADTIYSMGLVTGTTFVDATVTPNSTWYYRVRAVGASGDSNWTVANAVTTPGLPAAPTGLTATTDDGTIRLTWTEPAGKVYAYEIYRGATPTGLSLYRSYTLGGSAIIVPEFRDTQLAAGTTYYYAVRGALWTNNSNPSQLVYTNSSATISATTPSAFNPPPKLEGAYIRGAWQQATLDAMAAEGAGDAAWGFRLIDGANQVAYASSVIWGSADRLTLRFSEAVNVSSNSLVLYDSQNRQIVANSFAMLDDRTAQWQFGVLTANKYWFQVTAASVADLNGATLDGEWTTSQATYAGAGDGLAGGDLNFRFNVLPGDVNVNGAVNVSDVIALRSRLGQPIGPTTWRSDLNVSGGINVSDVIAIRSWLGLSLSNFADPVLPAAPWAISAAPIWATYSAALQPMAGDSGRATALVAGDTPSSPTLAPLDLIAATTPDAVVLSESTSVESTSLSPTPSEPTAAPISELATVSVETPSVTMELVVPPVVEVTPIAAATTSSLRASDAVFSLLAVEPLSGATTDLGWQPLDSLVSDVATNRRRQTQVLLIG